MTLIVEDGTGLANANSYASLTEANAYHDARLHALEWTAATDATKEKALALATTTLDAMVVWQGDRMTGEQALAWPRSGAAFDGFEVEDDSVPAPVKRATSELARLLIAEDLTQDVAQNDLASLNLGKGALEIDFRNGTDKRRVPTIVGELLQGLGRFKQTSGGINQRRATR